MNEVRLTARKGRWIVLCVITLIAAGLLSPWASSHPDGLERVAEDYEFLHRAEAVHEWAPIPDYEVGGIPWTALRIGLAGVIGAAVMLAVLWGVLRALTGKGRERAGGTDHGHGAGASSGAAD
ncbi:PDGLE domain-containing protein [Paenibacillus arenilitoris]|uniref:PDGLE domain-containing protein n=1 Tax=Paenibacillus arenilitoris TaxID=2772299 RepID=A0A927H9K7_9BACL|nr:PDGLE domain-containing protein [Paenibacillus arenilitoris]MBD2872838.1 PDGLE domain-containing protein [Paenibacillus arenilitoris]